MMTVRHAKKVARHWVEEEASRMPGFFGAFYHGSIGWLPDEATFPATSDVDIMVVLSEPPPVKLGKFIYRDVLLEVSYLRRDQLQLPEQVLGVSHLAGSFRAPSVICDPTGQLSRLQAAVARNYAKRKWVYKRCEHARDKVLRNLAGLNEADQFHDQVSAWLFAAGVTTHILLVAGLGNPTVRRRYVATRRLLAQYDQLDFYESLLVMLGCAQMSLARVEYHLAALTEVFDTTKRVIRTPFFFASDLSDLSRPIAIDGSREMIEAGYHREAVFWIVATYSRCQKVLHHDGSEEMKQSFTPGYRELVGDLGIRSLADLRRRGEEIREGLPQVWRVTEAIIAANPHIRE